MSIRAQEQSSSDVDIARAAAKLLVQRLKSLDAAVEQLGSTAGILSATVSALSRLLDQYRSPNLQQPPSYLTPKDVAKSLGIGIDTARKWMSRALGRPGYDKPRQHGAKLRIEPQVWLAWLESQHMGRRGGMYEFHPARKRR